MTQSINIAASKHSFPRLGHFFMSFIAARLWVPICILHYIGKDRKYYD